MFFGKIDLLKIIQPTWYYLLLKNKPTANNFKILDKHLVLNYYDKYKSKSAEKLDLNYQKILRGYFDLDFQHCDEKVPLIDQYTFVRRMFKSVWVYFAFIVRLVTLNNPIKEIKILLSTRHVEKISFEVESSKNQEFLYFSSKLIKDEPFISVIIPTLNRYSHLKNALNDLCNQDYRNFEVIIVDQSEQFDLSFYDSFLLNKVIIRQKERGLWKARNRAIKKCKGEYLLFYEDDVRVNSDWISNHLKVLEFFGCDISVGVFHPNGEKIPNRSRYFRLASQFSTGNAMVKKNIFHKVGLFDLQFEKMRMGDGEFGARCVENDIIMINNPFASCIDVKADQGGFRETGSWDGYRSKSFFDPKPFPSVIYYYRKYWGKKSAIYTLVKLVPLTLVPYSMKNKKSAYTISLVLFFLFFPILFYKAIISWNIASKMLNEGHKISSLE